MNNRRTLSAVFGPLVVGLWALQDIVTKPRLATVHGSDVVQLVAAGMCFGVAIAALVNFFLVRSSRASSSSS